VRDTDLLFHSEASEGDGT